MKQLAELIPVVVFFVVYQMNGETISIGGWHHHFDGIYSATAALMIATVIQIAATLVLVGRIESRLWFLLGAVLVFGGATLWLHDRLFIQWKPTLFNWGMATAFIATQYLTGKSAMARLMGDQLALPDLVWRRLNTLWVANFLLVGALNLVVAYRFSEQVWVSSKLYSMIVFTLLLSALTVALIMPHLRQENDEPPAAAG